MVKAVSKAFGILDFVLESAILGRDASLSDVASAIGIQSTTARNILKTMEQCAYIARGPRRSYIPGPKCSDMEKVATFSKLTAQATVVIDELARKSGQSVVLATLLHNRRCVLLRCEGAGIVRIDPELAESGDFYSLVTSRVLAAYSTADRLAGLVDENGMPGGQWDDINSQPVLEKALERIRYDGYESDYPGPTRFAIAVPVLAGDGTLLAALGLHMPTEAMDEKTVSDLIENMRNAASQISDIY